MLRMQGAWLVEKIPATPLHTFANSDAQANNVSAHQKSGCQAPSGASEGAEGQACRIAAPKRRGLGRSPSIIEGRPSELGGAAIAAARSDEFAVKSERCLSEASPRA